MFSKAGYTLIVKYAVTIAKCEKRKVYGGVFRVIFMGFTPRFSRFAAFRIRVDIRAKVKGFCGLFFRDINKTENLHEIRKMYGECSVFHGVFRKNICKM